MFPKVRKLPPRFHFAFKMHNFSPVPVLSNAEMKVLNVYFLMQKSLVLYDQAVLAQDSHFSFKLCILCHMSFIRCFTLYRKSIFERFPRVLGIKIYSRSSSVLVFERILSLWLFTSNKSAQNWDRNLQNLTRTYPKC